MCRGIMDCIYIQKCICLKGRGKMKKKLLVTLLALTMTSSMLSGCVPAMMYQHSENKKEEAIEQTEEQIIEDIEELGELAEDLDISKVDLEEDDNEEITEDKEDNAVEAVVSDELSDDWKDMQFQLNGQVFTLPCDYSAIEALGYTLDSSETEYTNGYILNANDTTLSSINLVNEEGAKIMVGFINTDDEAKDILECQIWSVTADITYEDVVPDLVLPGGITWGATLEEVEDAYGMVGDEDNIYISDLGYTAYTYNEDSKYLDVDVYTNDPDGEYEGVTSLSIREY